METPVVLVPNTSQPKAVLSGASEVMIVSDEPDCSSNSKAYFMAIQNINTRWVKIGCTVLFNSHKEAILCGDQLDDTVINYSKIT